MKPWPVPVPSSPGPWRGCGCAARTGRTRHDRRRLPVPRQRRRLGRHRPARRPVRGRDGGDSKEEPVKHAPAWLTAAHVHEAVLVLLAVLGLAALIFMARAVARVSRLLAKATAPAAAPSSSGKINPKLLLLGALGAGCWFLYESRHKTAATGGHAAPV